MVIWAYLSTLEIYLFVISDIAYISLSCYIPLTEFG